MVTTSDAGFGDIASWPRVKSSGTVPAEVDVSSSAKGEPPIFIELFQYP
jgi:hypothetical protein